MANVFDIARYILDQQGCMSAWKLQKLVYYSQAWHYTWTEKPLFQEKIEAWQNGPVCPALYAAHRGMFMIDPKHISGYPDRLTDDERETIDIVLKTYGPRDAYSLREQTHAEDPWIIARNGLPDDAPSNNEISLDSMGAYYGSL